MVIDDTKTATEIGGPDPFDRALGMLDGLPEALAAGPSTIQSVTPMVGDAETFIVQTVRVPEIGETVFLQILSARRSLRLVIPPKVAAAIGRQSTALSARLRSRLAKRNAQARKAAGLKPGFASNPGRGGRKSKTGRVRTGRK